jgi:uncharacterized protein YqjF (DUF2071 family)
MRQVWDDVLFAHWRVEPDVMRRALPPALAPRLDTYDGSAWLGIVPFEITALQPRGVRAGMRFAELNVRTYCTVGGKPGVYFFSLDAESRFAVAGARLSYRLPYFPAAMRVERAGQEVIYESRRTRGRAAELRVRYAPAGDAAVAEAGTLEHFLVERYCLYVQAGPRIWRADIDHPPWPLQPAEATFERNTMTPLELAGEPLLHYAAREDVRIWPPRR